MAELKYVNLCKMNGVDLLRVGPDSAGRVT